jgi:hypothetical protein
MVLSKQVEDMIKDIKKLEPIVGKTKTEKYVRRSLERSVKKGEINQIEFTELMSKLGYDA